MRALQTKANRKLAIEWAQQVIKPNTPLWYSDRFWEPFKTEGQVVTAIRRLLVRQIFAFDAGGYGAFLIHADNPNLTVVHKEGLCGGAYVSNDTVVMLCGHRLAAA